MRRSRPLRSFEALRRSSPRSSAGLDLLVLAMVALLGAGALAVAAPAHAGLFGSFRDPESGKLDLSEWLLDRKGFLPVPIFVTEPAVGYGGGIGLVFFRESLREAEARAAEGHPAPPDVFGAAGAATQNGTRFAGGGGMFSFRDDRWRYRGGAGWTDARLDFYGAGRGLAGGVRKVGYELEGWFALQQALYRIGDSRSFLSLRWFYLDFASRLARESDEAGFSELAFETRNSGIGPSWEYDSRDNVFTPTQGIVAAVDALFYREAIGSDRDFETYRAHLFGYFPAGEKLIVALRVDGRAAAGDAPFYQLPFLELRGVPLGRYQDERTGILETELRWRVVERWELIGFGGVGRAWGARAAFDDAEDQIAGGVGFRYEIARRLGLWAGMDFAWGPEEEAFYIQVGSAWR